MRRTVEVTPRGRVISETIASELGVMTIMIKIKIYRKKMEKHKERIKKTRSPKQDLQYTAVSRSTTGRNSSIPGAHL